MAAKKGVGPQIDEQAHKFYATMFANPNQGSTFVLEAMPVLMRRTLAYELKGQFTQGELQLMLDVMNGTMLVPALAGQQITANCSDGIALNGLDQKWQVERKPFLARLGSLTNFQLAALEIWAKGYWDAGINKGDKENGIARWLKMLL